MFFENYSRFSLFLLLSLFYFIYFLFFVNCLPYFRLLIAEIQNFPLFFYTQ